MCTFVETLWKNDLSAKKLDLHKISPLTLAQPRLSLKGLNGPAGVILAPASLVYSMGCQVYTRRHISKLLQQYWDKHHVRRGIFHEGNNL